MIYCPNNVNYCKLLSSSNKNWFLVIDNKINDGGLRMTNFEEFRNGFEYEVLLMNDQNQDFKVIVNYKGFDQHFVMWISNDLNEAIDIAIEELHKVYPFEQLVFEYE